MRWPDTGLAWLPTSPNIADFETSLLYPGIGLLEGTCASEGRGTTEPFRLVGWPGIDGEALAAKLNRQGLAGALEGTTLVLSMRFEENGKELAGSVTKNLPGLPPLTIPIGGEVSNTTMRLRFALAAENGQLAVHFQDIDFAASLAFDVNGQAAPDSIVQRLQIQQEFVETVKASGRQGILTSGLEGGLSKAMAQLLEIAHIHHVRAVRPGRDGGLEVEGID